MAYVREDLLSQQLQLGGHLRDKCTMWNSEVGWKSIRNLEIFDKQSSGSNSKVAYSPDTLSRQFTDKSRTCVLHARGLKCRLDEFRL